MYALSFLVASVAFGLAAGHGNMLKPMPREGHGQTFDDRNKCGSNDPYSNASTPGEYCGLGCLGEACLYYQIGCFAGCGTCSYVGKDLYPTASDLQKAGDCKPIEPTIMDPKLRTYNIDGASSKGDWTKVNPWRAPGTTGMGNPAFQPCGVNSGANPTFPLPPAGGQPPFANGTDLPPLPGKPTVWRRGSVQNVSFGIYANHGGGYSYRLCKKDDEGKISESSCQQIPLEFASDKTEIKYHDGSRAPFFIPATTTSTGTHPAGSQWRKNPIPMCNCDIGIGCGTKEHVEAEDEAKKASAAAAAVFYEEVATKGGKTCKAVPESQCGSDIGYNTCLKCGDSSLYDCEVCCPGLTKVTKSGYSYCMPSKPAPQPSGVTEPYPKSYLRPGQKADRCPTGLMFESSWDDGYGSGHLDGRYGTFMFTMQDQVKIPADIATGDYVISWRWDCEQTPQVWNSCADLTVA